jgi:hypothetical protein
MSLTITANLQRYLGQKNIWVTQTGCNNRSQTGGFSNTEGIAMCGLHVDPLDPTCNERTRVSMRPSRISQYTLSVWWFYEMFCFGIFLCYNDSVVNSLSLRVTKWIWQMKL